MSGITMSYYPGCSLHGTAREYDITTRAVCKALDIELVELPDWNCCGASSAHRFDEQLAQDLPGRNLDIAIRQGMDLVIPCAACYNRTKTNQVHRGMTDALGVLSLVELLNRRDVRKRIAELLVKPLDKLAVVPYYGCLLTRPTKATGAQTAFNPTAMDDLLELVGADVRRWSCKTTCCGASFTLAETGIVQTLCTQLRDSAIEAGAKAFVTACPMCTANLDTRQKGEPKLPAVYITELLAAAMGLEEVKSCWPGHFVDPRPVLRECGLIS